MPSITVTYDISKPYTYIRNGYEEQDYETVDEFEYEIDYTFKDILDYVKSKEYKDWSKEKKDGFVAGVEMLYDFFSDTIEDSLEEDDDFIEFIKEKYEDEALEHYYESL